ncbi:MAG: type II toxin-antitoxin system PemK/MazF family toxin [Tetrasphaera sp.]
MTPEHAEAWWCEHPEIGRRPVIVLSRSSAVSARRRAVVAPCTTVHRGLPSEVELDPKVDPVPRACVVATDSLESVPASLLLERLGRLADNRMREVCAAIAVSLDCSGG